MFFGKVFLRLRYTVLGKSGVRVSVIGLGFWQIGSRLWGLRDCSLRSRVREALELALFYGINFLDTAEVYGDGLSEVVLGEVVRALGREYFIVASKVAGYRVRVGSVIKGVEGINRRLGFKVDLIQMHWPPPYPWPLCWSIRGLEEAVSRGLAGYYGLSNFPKNLLEKSLQCSRRFEPVSNQIQYSLVFRVAELDLIPYMREVGLTPIAWSPLAKGALAGLREASAPAQIGDRVFTIASRDDILQRTLEEIAGKRMVSKAQIALAWLISKGAIPIPGFRSPSRVIEYAKAGDLMLGEDDVRALDEVSMKYIHMWGRGYSELKMLRFIPAFIQWLTIKLMGGI